MDNGRMSGAAPATLTLQEAAERLGVHYMTAYRYLRLGRLEAQRRGGRWLVEEADVDRLLEASRRAGSGARGGGRGHPSTAPGATVPAMAVSASERLLGRLLAGDGPGCWAVVEEGLVSGSPTDVYLNLVAPALRRLGDGWTDGSISVASEHRATACALRLVGRLSPLFSRPGRRRRGTVVLAGAAGDRHVMPGAMVGDVLRGEGFDVIDLGADVPSASLLEVIGEAPELLAVGLSVSTDAALASASRTVAALHESYPKVPVLVGGPVVAQPSVAEALGADHWAPDAMATAQLLIRLSERPRVGVA